MVAKCWENFWYFQELLEFPNVGLEPERRKKLFAGFLTMHGNSATFRRAKRAEKNFQGFLLYSTQNLGNPETWETCKMWEITFENLPGIFRNISTSDEIFPATSEKYLALLESRAVDLCLPREQGSGSMPA